MSPLVQILGLFHCSIIPLMSCLIVATAGAINDSLVFSQVFDGAVIVLSLAPMVASTVANGPSSPWDAIGLIITLRIWRVKRIIDGGAGRGWYPPRPVFYCQGSQRDPALCSLHQLLL